MGPVLHLEESLAHSVGDRLEGRMGLQANEDVAGTTRARNISREGIEWFVGNLGRARAASGEWAWKAKGRTGWPGSLR